MSIFQQFPDRTDHNSCLTNLQTVTQLCHGLAIGHSSRTMKHPLKPRLIVPSLRNNCPFAGRARENCRYNPSGKARKMIARESEERVIVFQKLISEVTHNSAHARSCYSCLTSQFKSFCTIELV